MNIITAVVVLIVAAVAIWYFVIREEEPAENNNYMAPINTWYQGYKSGDATKMLSAWVPCLSKSDTVIDETNDLLNSATGKLVYLQYQEERSEVVNSTDQVPLNDLLNGICGTDSPTIQEYRHVYIKAQISNTETNKVDEVTPEFYTARINNKWYILAFQEEKR